LWVFDWRFFFFFFFHFLFWWSLESHKPDQLGDPLGCRGDWSETAKMASAILIALFLLLVEQTEAAAAQKSSRTWSVSGPATLVETLRKAAAGDVIELEPGEYLLRSSTVGAPALLFERPVVLRSRDASQRAVLRADGASVLMAAVSSGVELRDLIVGRQTGGADVRAIDLFVSAGTQVAPANRLVRYTTSIAAGASPVGAAHLAQIDNALVDGDLYGNGPVSSDAAEQLRALRGLVVQNVDFSRSLAGTNVAFAQGAYVDVVLERNWFAADSAAIVAVAKARVDGTTLAVHRNVFGANARVVFGGAHAGEMPTAAFGRNRWLGAEPAALRLGVRELVVPETTCVDADCTRFGPIVDADVPDSAYATLGDAVAAGVRRVRLTGDVVLDSPVLLMGAAGEMTIDGGEECGSSAAASPLLTIRGAGVAVQSNGALAGVRNLRVKLEGAGASGFVLRGGSESSVVLFDGVSVLGDDSDGQAAFVVDSAAAQVELRDTLVVAVARGLALQSGGGASLVDTTFVGSSEAAVLVTSDAQLRAALRVAGSTFVGCASAVRLSERGGGVALMRELRVECSNFLFNAQLAPVASRECVARPALCSTGVRHNTVIGAAEEQTSGEARTLRAGGNHVELGRQFEQYVYAGEPRHFSLRDDQGRLSWASGALLGDAATGAEFVVASYAPMRTECLAAGESVDVGSAEAAVVSDVLEVRADTLLHQCGGVGVRFRIADAASLPDAAELAVYGVAGVGTSRVRWERAATAVSTEGRDAGAAVVLEATLSTNDAAQRHQHRVVIVSHALLPEAVAAAIDSGAALVGDTVLNRAAGRSLCVACGGVAITPADLDRLCGGSSGNVRTSFDAAYAELGFGASSGAPRRDPVSLVVFGKCELQTTCIVALDQNEHLEGSSPGSASISRAAKSQCPLGAPLVLFGERAAKSSVRQLTINGASVTDNGCAVVVEASAAQLGPTVAQCAIDGSLCVRGRLGGKYINNELRGSIEIALPDATRAPTSAAPDAVPILIEANLLSSGGILVTAVDESTARADVRITRNTFRTDGTVVGAIIVAAARTASIDVHVVGNRNLGAFAVGTAGAAAGGGRVSAIDNTFATDGAAIILNGEHCVYDGGSAAAPQRLVDSESTDLWLGEGAELRNVHLGARAKLTVADRARAILYNVEFDSIGETLRDARCAGIELKPVGVALERSLIYNSGVEPREQIFGEAERAVYASQPGVLFWSAKTAHLARCAGVRGACGCETGEAVPPVAPIKVGELAAAAHVVDAGAVVVAAESGASSNTLLTVLLLVGGGALLLCIGVAVCVAVSRSSTSAQVALRRGLSNRPTVQSNAVNMPNRRSDSPGALSALQHRKSLVRNEQ
jgi:hypothetical protein